MKKTVQVIMIQAANPRSDGCFNFITDTCNEINHLYFISHGKIKEGNWLYNDRPEIGIFKAGINHEYYTAMTGFNKVIATTDKSLNLPLISDSFVKDYVNSNGEIKEVDILWNDKFNVPVVYNAINKEIVFWTHGDEKASKKQTKEEAYKEWSNEFSDGSLNGRDWNLFQAGAKWQSKNQ